MNSSTAGHRLPLGLSPFEGALFLEGDPVEEAKGGDGEVDRIGGQLLLVDQKHLVGTDLLRTQCLGRPVEVACEQGDLEDVGGLRAR